MAVVNETLYRYHGEFMFTRLIASGPNTNPWMSEAHDKIVQPGDLVGIDTDANTYEGYVVDISRTFLCGDNAHPGQKEAYRIAYDCVNGMRELLKPGMSFTPSSRSRPRGCRRVSDRALRRHGAPGRGSKTKGRGSPTPTP